MKRIFCYGILLLLLFSCSSKDTIDSTDLMLVTGMNLVDFTGNNIGKFGNPNVVINSNVAFYPNPATRVVNIRTINNLKNVWVIKGNASRSYSNVDFSNELNSNIYSTSEIDNSSIFKVLGVSVNNISLNISNYDEGFYRIFIQLEDDTLLWNNLYFNPSTENIDDINFWR